jgi:membrane protein implicated in regulation of membrane protease activity
VWWLVRLSVRRNHPSLVSSRPELIASAAFLAAFASLVALVALVPGSAPLASIVAAAITLALIVAVACIQARNGRRELEELGRAADRDDVE